MSLLKTERQNNKRKFILPLILISFLVSLLLVKFVKGLNLELFLPVRRIINPSVEPTEEEKLRRLFGQFGLKLDGLTLGENEHVATLSGNTTVLFSSKKNLKSQVASLQFIISRSKIEGKIPSKIDLRFEKPVAVY